MKGIINYFFTIDLERYSYFDTVSNGGIPKTLIVAAVQEPWARKMILLLMELGASGWKLPPEANEYYFQQTNS
ncbi:unnamed protein product [Toxocara canis]|uniref:ANK_REP_REGION domain-containing protein n=1 Tax=Toxocara canis TaxID=6265 RepID=A0A183U824_TOXCA|nr:unnamed protein product [Toxocara canis]